MSAKLPFFTFGEALPKTVILNSAKDLPRVAHLVETLRQAQADTLGALLGQSPSADPMRMLQYWSIQVVRVGFNAPRIYSR